MIIKLKSGPPMTFPLEGIVAGLAASMEWGIWGGVVACSAVAALWSIHDRMVIWQSKGD